jgi:hypothetical protein
MLTALLLAVLQDAPVDLRWTFAPAQERRFRIHQVFDLGGVALEARDLVAVTVLEVDPEGTALLRGRYEAVALRSTGIQKYEYDSEKSREPGEHPNARMIAVLLGRTFEFRMSRAGEILEVRGFARILEDMVRAAGGAQEEALAQQLFKQMFTDAIMKSRLQLMSTGLPAAPVRPGEDWENLMRLRLPIVGVVRFRGKSRVVGVKDGDAWSTASRTTRTTRWPDSTRWRGRSWSRSRSSPRPPAASAR